MSKIKSITISGIRGIKDPLTLVLNEKSTLVYGDNGTGKSSLTDSIEWFFRDKVNHLRGEEIPKNGKEAIRNIFASEDEDGFVEINFTNSDLDCSKSLDGSLKVTTSNTSEDFSQFINASASENLILRYSDIIKFIIARKAERLTELQQIIGFSEVANIRALLKRNAGRVARTIKNTDYENQKSSKQQTILENLGRNAYTDEQLFQGANELIKVLELGKVIESREDINSVLKEIQSRPDTKIVEEISFQTRIREGLSEVMVNIETIERLYSNFYPQFSELNKDSVKVKNLQLLTFLAEGLSVLKKDVYDEGFCPLCQQEKNKLTLIQELNQRIEDLQITADEKSKLDEKAEELNELLASTTNRLIALLKEKLFKDEKYNSIKNKIENLQEKVSSYSEEVKKEISTPLLEPEKLGVDKKELTTLIDQATERAKELTEKQSANIKLQTYTKLLLSSKAYVEYHKIKKEEEVLNKQHSTLQLLYEDFIRRQEEALNNFISIFSKDINHFYTIMNPGEKVDEIRLVPLTKNEELVGITIEYKFYSKKVKPPTAYLSESHVNCLGISFFLASVKAFNKCNKFMVLDDVISSFDRSHRARFAKLLTNEFPDYQILLFTHEKEFFELIASDVKGKGWLINALKWNKTNGTEIETSTTELQEVIEKKIQEKNLDGLGNKIRIFTEKHLKKIAFNIEAPVAFRYNVINEKRMAGELSDSIQSRISKKSKDLKEKVDMSKIKGMSLFLNNTTSHDNDFNESIEDLELIWEQLNDILDVFYCEACDKPISVNYIDPVTNKIRCKCGTLSYAWK